MQSFDVLDPFRDQIIEQIEYTDEAHLNKKIEHAVEIAENRKKWIPKVRRIDILKKFYEILNQNRKLVIIEAIEEGGKPYKDTIVEFNRALNGITVAIETLSQLAGREVPMGLNQASRQKLAYTNWEPRGLVIAISAFNHPINLIIHQIIPALAAGCPIIIKPAAKTPLTCMTLVRFLYEAGLDEHYVQVVHLPHEMTAKLVGHEKVRFLSFIGSSAVGNYLKKQLPAGATCCLEHGGSAPVIIDEQADFEKAVLPLVKASFYHAGQVCVSAQRIYLHQSIKKDFLDLFIKETEKLKVGDPKLEETDIGPMISQREKERVNRVLREAIEGGASYLYQGMDFDNLLMAPSILENIPSHSDLYQRELFGPSVGIYEFEELKAAIMSANQLPFSFQASLYTQNLNTALESITELNAVTVLINEHPAFRVDWMPFGGQIESGEGLGGIPDSIKAMSFEKMTIFNIA
jgi:acyl-CoA reductase-like NAD-dependent aldehyde dehydrogenase